MPVKVWVSVVGRAEPKSKDKEDYGGQGLANGRFQESGAGVGPRGATSRMLSSKQTTEVAGTWRNSRAEKAELGGS